LQNSQSLKVLFVSRSTLYEQAGGDTIQVEQTAHYLRQLGCTVDIYTSGPRPKLDHYEVLHFFNIIRPFDILPFLKERQKQAFFISSIYVDYSSSVKYSSWAIRFLYSAFGKNTLELIKAKARWLKGKDRFPGFNYLFRGHKKSIEYLLRQSDAVLAATESEILQLRRDFKSAFKGKKIDLGTEHIGSFSESTKHEHTILCAGRIEMRKNQLNLIKAVKNSRYQLTLAGQAATNQKKYYKACKEEASPNIKFAGHLSLKELNKEYTKAKVHALPSFHETTGLSSLEALLAGCQIVVSNTDIQKEIFMDKAHYCDPGKPESIAQAIDKAMEKKESHQNWVKENFSWKQSAEKILNLYREFLTNNQT